METENTIEKTFTQGKGDEELKMTVHVTAEEEKMMEQIKSHSPMDWEGKDLQLLMEARRIIRENKQNEEHVGKVETPKQEFTYKETGSNKSSIIWFSIGIACIIALIIVFASVKRKTNEAMHKMASSSYGQSFITKTMNYRGVTFNYPGNWDMTGKEIDGGVIMVGGFNEKESEFGVFVTPDELHSFYDNVSGSLDIGTYDDFRMAMQDQSRRKKFFDNVSDYLDIGDFNSFNSFIDNYFMTRGNAIEAKINDVVTGYATCGRFSDVSYSSIYKASICNRDALCADYSYISNEKHYFAKLYGFDVCGNSVIVNCIAHEESDLEGDDFKMIEGSLEVKP